MAASVVFEKFGFSLDLAGEEIEALGFDLAHVMAEESPLGTIEDVWEDKALRRRFPDAIDKVGEMDAAVLLGRLTSLFGAVTLAEGEIESVGFRAPLLVFRSGDAEEEAVAVAVAFDRLGASCLSVVAFEDDERLPEKVAREFWGLIFNDLDELEDEDVRVFNAEEDAWISYGVAKGVPFLTHDEAEPEELEEFEEEPFGQEQYDEFEAEDREKE